MNDSKVSARTSIAAPLRVLIRYALRRLAINENVSHGSNLRVGRGCVLSSPHGLRIGNNVSIGPRTIVQVDGDIGDFAMIGMGVQIVGRNDHLIDEPRRPMILSTWVGDRPIRESDRISIGADVWVGGSSVILSGITIGRGAVVAAGSVVTRDVEPFTVVGGNPARFIKRRFEHQADEATHGAWLDEHTE